MAHYEPIWKHASVNDALTAVTYLNSNIDQITHLIRGISHERANLLQKSGIECIAKDLCQKERLASYILAY